MSYKQVSKLVKINDNELWATATVEKDDAGNLIGGADIIFEKDVEITPADKDALYEEITGEKLSSTEELRRKAYQAESDPLFFKWQRGEATMEEWLAKVAEIKERYK